MTSHLLRAITVAHLLLHRHLGHAQVLARSPPRSRRRPRSPRRRARPPARSAAGRSSPPCRPPWCGAAARPCRRAPPGRPSNSMRVSIASRVVPATGVTITRSSPSSLLTSDDLPTFGRPISASRVASSASSRRPRAGARRSGRAGRRCRGPAWPRRPSGRPGRARRTRPPAPPGAASSTLLAATITGTGPPRSSRASSASPGAQPRASVDHEHGEIGLLERDSAWRRISLRHLVLAGEVDPAGVDQREAERRSTRPRPPCGRG